MPGTRAPVSACIVAYNEEDRIGDCLRSLAWCDELLVVDSHSSDGTREVAAAHGARVLERDWPGYAEQKQLAVREAGHDWVLCLDADERVSPELRRELEALRDAGFAGAAGWRAPRLSCYLGRWIRHGSWHPDLQLRLFDRRRGRWTGGDLHERVRVEGEVRTLRGPLLHHPYRDLGDHLSTIDRYTGIAAERLHREGRRARWHHLLLRPPWRFLRFYLLERGFLEGWRGVLLAWLAAYYVRLKYVKLWLLRRAPEREPPASP